MRWEFGTVDVQRHDSAHHFLFSLMQILRRFCLDLISGIALAFPSVSRNVIGHGARISV